MTIGNVRDAEALANWLRYNRRPSRLARTVMVQVMALLTAKQSVSSVEFKNVKQNCNWGSVEMLACPQCGEDTETFHEGYCAECCEANQRELDQHNHEFDRWQRLTGRQRDAEIRGAVKNQK